MNTSFGVSSLPLPDLLEPRRNDILQRWEARVQRTLLGGAELAFMQRGELFESILTRLRDFTASDLSRRSARRLGQELGRSEVEVEVLVREHGLLRDIILEVLEEEGWMPDFASMRALGHALDDHLADTLKTFSRERARALRASESKLNDILDHSPLAIYVKDANGRYVFVNRSYEMASSLPRETVVGRTDREIFTPEVAELFVNNDQQVLSGGRPITYHERVMLPDGYHVFRSLKFPLPDSDGIASAVCGISSDVTEAERLQKERDEARGQLQNLFNHLPIIVWTINAEGIITLFEGEGLLSVDQRPGMHVGRSIFDVFAHRPDLMPLVHRVLSGESFTEELPALDHWFLVRFSPSFGPNGEVTGASSVGLDITERRRAEDEARRRAEFEQLLIAIVGHDLRNPISAIIMSAATMLRREALEESQRKPLARILSSAERAARLLRDVLDFTQARLGGGIPMQPRPSDLNELVRQVVEEVQLAHPERRLTVDCSGDGRGVWDPDRLAQVITNLVNNAITHSPDHCTVEVRTHGGPEGVALSVHNLGPPIPPALLPRLFEPMKRAEHQEMRDSHGLGLGLFIVKHIVDAHGGALHVHSTEQEGTTVRVRLPRRLPSRPSNGD